jgi:stage III sporulation protein SpoIIIAA
LEQRTTDDIEKLLSILPDHIREALEAIDRMDDLIEVVLDLGRLPAARYTDGEEVLANTDVSRDDLDWIILHVGTFDADNRAGMERTLHRISAIRNRQNVVIGLTCRVGRAIFGTIDIIEDLIMSGHNVLILGAPGVGKTTLLREAARVLAENKRVVIVDTSNEIGGDGDVPHPAVGRARRMQVREPALQHEVMIEAVENHNPEVIIIDEIGRELEAQAARTIAERGVQLIGTAHGNALDNLMLNPTLSDLVGGIESVTLSDDEARRRGTQKTVLERRSPPTFDVLVEIQTRDRMVIHSDVSTAVDGLLRGSPPDAELRERDEEGLIHVISMQVQSEHITERQMGREAAMRSGRGAMRARNGNGNGNTNGNAVAAGSNVASNSPNNVTLVRQGLGGFNDTRPNFDPHSLTPLNVYVYGVARNRLAQSARRLHVPLTVVDDFDQANAVVTIKPYYRKRPRMIVDAERQGMPIYVLRANTVSQIEAFLADLFNLAEKVEQTPSSMVDRNDDDADDTGRYVEDPFARAMRETEAAILRIRAGEESIDLTPQNDEIRRQQQVLIRKAQLLSESDGNSQQRFVRVIHP